ncbi:MAG: hypothetical protein HOW73_02865 [Polyangiaceae bacterium]|nr:hypothetical protein [Polyangiaceae bacterium]
MKRSGQGFGPFGVNPTAGITRNSTGGNPVNSHPSSSNASSSSSSNTRTLYLSAHFVDRGDGQLELIAGKTIAPDTLAIDQLIGLLLEMKPGFNQGSYQALAKECARRLKAEGREQDAQLFDAMAAQTPSSLMPASAPHLQPFDSSKGQLGNIDMIRQFYGNREETRGGQRRILVGPSDDSRFQLDDMTTPSGTFAYVTLLNGQTLVWPCDPKGTDTFHGGLSYFAPYVAFAGTVTFNKDGSVHEWNADSGTYKPEVRYNAQAPFPQDKFRQGLGY